MEFAGFLGPTAGSPSHLTWNNERSLNLISLMLKPPSRGRPGQWRLVGTPGLTAFASAGSVPFDLWAQDDRMWAVSRDEVYEVFENGTMTLRGAVLGDSRRASFASNGDLALELLVNTGGKGYILNLQTHALTPITDVDFPANARNVLYIDGYFIVVSEGSMAFSLSDILAGANWSGLDVGEKSSTSDRLKGIIFDGTLIWLLGSKRTEIWKDTGDPSFPWSPIDDVIVQQGLLAPDTVCNVGSPIWLGANEHGGCVAYRARGYDAERISTTELEEIWQGYATAEDAYAWAYEMTGQMYWVLTFPAGGTFVYNATTGLWHQWSTYNTLTGLDDVYAGRSHAYCWEKHYVSDRRSGAIYQLDPNARTDAGTAIRRLRRAPHIAAEDYSLINSRFALDVQTGDAPLSGQGSDPFWRLRYSDDASRTWSYFLDEDSGQRGDYGRIVEWWRLGEIRKGRTFEVWFSDPQFVGIAGAYLELERS